MTNLLIQVGQGSDWELCRLFHMSHGNNHYLRLAIESGDHITLYGLREALAYKLRALLALIENHDVPEPEAGFITQRDVTPLETIEKFQASEALTALAGDVESALGNLVSDAERVKKVLDPAGLADLFTEHGRPVRGAQARIAEALGLKNAGADRHRILKTLQTLQREQLSKSTTTGQKPLKPAKTA